MKAPGNRHQAPGDGGREASGIRHQASGAELPGGQRDFIASCRSCAPVSGTLNGDGMQNAKHGETPLSSQFSILNSQSPLPSAWDDLLGRPFDRPPFRDTLAAAETLALRETVYPPREDWFAALRLTPPEKVRVVILGQDPYHEPGQAMGLAFSVQAGVKLPPSLRNIYKELEADLGVPAPQNGDLTLWAEQGVLLLNTVLTVRAGAANSHKTLGWQTLTSEILAAVSRLPQPVAFVLWGDPAQRAFFEASGIRHQASGAEDAEICRIGNGPSTFNSQFSILNSQFPRLILTAPHPSPLSAYRGFFGSRPFSQINAFLEEQGEAPIRWTEAPVE